MHLVELAPCMSPARCQLDMTGVRKPLESWIAIHMDGAPEALQMSCRALSATIRAVEIDSHRWIGAAPWPVVPGVDPQSAGLGAAAARIKHRDRRVVGEQSLRGEHMLSEPCLQGLQPPDRSTHPVGERRTMQFHAMPSKDLALSVQRKVIAVLG